MFSIFDLYSSKGPIKLDATLVRHCHDNRESLIHSKTYKEISACMDKSNEEFSLSDSWSCLCLITLFYTVVLCWWIIFLKLLRLIYVVIVEFDLMTNRYVSCVLNMFLLFLKKNMFWLYNSKSKNLTKYKF